MIFFEGDNNKKTLMVVLASVCFIVLAVQWTRFNPIKNIPQNEDNFWQNIDAGVGQASNSLQFGFEQSQVDLKNIGDDLKQDLQQAAILEETKEYLEEKKNSSSSTTTVEEVLD